MIYFDNAATTKINEHALKELIEKSKNNYGNPSTRYSLGVEAKKMIEVSRKKIADLIGCNCNDLFFTSGGTESNNIIIQSLAKKNCHVISTSIEHESIINSLKYLQKYGCRTTYINPNKDGIIQIEKIEEAITKDTVLICVQMINNELGTIQKIKDIGDIAKKYNIHLHVDAVQAVGHININIDKDFNIDSLSASAHKFGGPKGIGFLYAKKHDIGLCFGGGQEKSVKSGTENVPSICAMAVALEYSLINLEEKLQKIKTMIMYLKNELKRIDNVVLNVDNNDYFSIINFRINNYDNEALVNFFDINGICVSTGSACSGNSFERSYVLKAIGLTNSQIDASLRISLSYINSLSECKAFISILNKGIFLLKHK